MESSPALLAAELVAKGIAPVKREYIRKFQSKVQVEAVTGRQGEQAAATEGKGVCQKSKSQKKRDRSAQVQAELCSNYAAGRCTFGTKCRFNHDLEGYLRSKPADLPGSCPFSSMELCPFGISCRWAGTHIKELPLVQAAKDALRKEQEQAAQNCQNGSALNGVAQLDPQPAQPSVAAAAQIEPLLAPRAAMPPAASGLAQSASECTIGSLSAEELGNGSVNAAGASNKVTDGSASAENDSGARVTNGSASADEPGKESVSALVIAGEPTRGSALGKAESSAALAPPAGFAADSSVPEGILILLVPSKVQKPVNNLSKQLQNKLWKNRYDFGTADAVVESLGWRTWNRKLQDGKGRGEGSGRSGGRGQKGRQQAGGRGRNQARGNQEDIKVGKGGEGTAAKIRLDDLAAVGQAGADSTGKGQAAADTAKLQQPGADSAGQAQDGADSAAQGQAADGPGSPVSKRPRLAHSEAAQVVTPTPNGGLPSQQGNVRTVNGGTATATPPQKGSTTETDPGESQAMDVDVPLRAAEKKKVDFRGKLYLAPLTTVGNLPFRRICKRLGADVTCGEMALATNLLQGQMSEWALLKRHASEDCFGVQICGGYPDAMARAAQLLEENTQVDFVDVNCGCPIELICSKAAGSSLLLKKDNMEAITRSMSRVLSCPVTLKLRKGYHDHTNVAHTLAPLASTWGAQAVTLHGRSRQQRYTKSADWHYVLQTARSCPDLQIIGNGDILSYTEYHDHMSSGALATCMLARGALIKPWIFTEIKEQRHWDISAGERLDMLKEFCSLGLEHWGSDNRGVENTRRFMLEWMSFQCRYVPVGLLEVLPQRMQLRPPPFYGRNDLETLLASDNAADWVKISEMLLGPAPADFVFAPKHKSNAYIATDADLAKTEEWGETNG